MRSTVQSLAALVLILLTACGDRGNGGDADASAAGDTADTAAPVVALACEPMLEQSPLEGRLSPYDSLRIPVDGEEALVCYGRPSSRGRTMIGGESVPYDQLWRTGANEPTTLHIPFAADIAGIQVEPGSYSLYTIPGRSQWTVIVNRSTSQWGEESGYTEEVRAQEVGRATVPADSTGAPVETFTMSTEPGEAGGTDLVLEWERTRIEIPIRKRAP